MRNKIGALAVAAMSMAGATQAAIPVQQNDKQQTVQQAKDVNNQRKVIQSKEIKVDPMTGGLDFGFYDRGRSPKEYGQFLQSRGLQKWNKKFN